MTHPPPAGHSPEASSPDQRLTAAGPDEQAEWDARYAAGERIWSGRPNPALVTEASALPPGRALDVGCGEGADAVWLAARGWDVTALDVSRVALERAARHAEQTGVDVRWWHHGLADAPLPAGAFELVSAHYPVLRRTPGADAEHALRGAVAPGGVLLVVHHADVDADHARAQGFDPADYVGPDDVAAVLGRDWRVEVHERRPRGVPTGAGGRQVDDLVLRARRVG